MSIIAGLDIGSYLSKAVIMNEEKILSYAIKPIHGNFSKSASEVLDKVLEECELSRNELNIVGGTGLGASFIDVDFVKNTEINCQSKGVHYFLPEAKTVIELGHQAARIIKLTGEGKVADFVINDKCANGSVRILKTVSKVLNISFEQMSELSLNSKNPVHFSTGCPVFLETEAISRVAEESSMEDIAAGLHQSIAIKVKSMIEKIHIDGVCAITGGGGKDLGLIKMIEKHLNIKLAIPEEPLITGAVGAALRAVEKKNTVKESSEF